MPDLDLGSPELAEVARVLAEAAGLSLSAGLRRTLRNGVEAAAASAGIEPLELARRIVAGDRASLAVLVEHAVVLETYFYRHPQQLALLGRLLFDAPGPLAIWSAGCASGEEPYSVAMALLEAGRAGRGDRIVATDVSERALATARAATYGPWALRRVPPRVAERWLAGPPASRSVAGEARALVELRRHNLVADPAPGGPFDAILCRNVLIYFEPPVAAEVLYRLTDALRPGGLLVVGPVELPLASALPLEWVDDQGGTVLRRRVEH
ncbi:MAG TPA: CheR family methyltransferase [Anaeromyxobacteraceae bacterium]|nr:CheR family methyltransferase [Anaeromyxobacteraceae bacterium]